MTESQAWRIVAEEYDAGRTWSRFLCVNLDSGCSTALDAIPLDLRMKMARRIHAALLPGANTAYDHRVLPDEQHGGRVLACLLFSEMSK